MTFKGGVTLSLFSTLWVAYRGANSRLKGKLAGKVRLTLTFSLAILFSTLPAIHSSSDAALISYGEVVRLSQDVTGWEGSESLCTSCKALYLCDRSPLNLSGHLPSAPECEPLNEWHQHNEDGSAALCQCPCWSCSSNLSVRRQTLHCQAVPAATSSWHEQETSVHWRTSGSTHTAAVGAVIGRKASQPLHTAMDRNSLHGYHLSQILPATRYTPLGAWAP